MVECRKALKKFWKKWKNTEKVPEGRKKSLRKTKISKKLRRLENQEKYVGKPEKAVLLCGKLEKDTYYLLSYMA